jgi:DNA-binding MarR family transcriptional regulator
MQDHKQSLSYLSAQLSRQLANRLREGLVPLGLLPAQFTALAEIARHEGLTQKQLVERLGIEQPGVARTLAGLEAMGWIDRRPLRGRAQGIWLTDRARAALPRAQEVVSAVDRQALSCFTRTERAHLLDALDEVIRADKPAT